MKILIIGTGSVGSVMAAYFARRTEVSEVRLADVEFAKAERLKGYLRSEKASVHRVDANKPDEVAKLAEGVDVVVNATVPPLNLSIMNGALKARAHYQDLASGPPYEVSLKQQELSDEWKKAKLTALMNTGIAPGITNILMANAAERLDRVNEIHQKIVGRFITKRPIARWSPETMWGDASIKPTIYENGEMKTVAPYSGKETYMFPEPFGSQTVVLHPHEEIFTIPRYINKGLRYMEVKIPLFI